MTGGHKNTNGQLGVKCGECGGYGFTNLITGGSAGCRRCNQTGIEPPDITTMQNRMIALEKRIAELEGHDH